jgi:hypothetical protein
MSLSSHVAPLPRLEYLLGMLRINRWISEKSSPQLKVFERRPEMYRWVAKDLLADQPVKYLEFGVFSGASMRFWVDCNQHPQSQFYGFDTFEGLPEDWQFFSGKAERGSFSAEGKIPHIDDSRVHFYKGLFQHTLPDFLARSQLEGQLVLHMDADLYSSTMYVLARMHSHMTPGTVLIFDEFTGPLDEFRAWTEYAHSHMRTYELLGQRKDFEQVVLRILT